MMRVCPRTGLPRRTLGGSLAAARNLTTPNGDAMDKLINSLSKITPAA